MAILLGSERLSWVYHGSGRLFDVSVTSQCNRSLYLAVCGRLRKSNYFLERVHVPDRSGIRSCLGEREASLPQTATQSHGFASQPGGGKHPHAQDTKPWFCVAAKGGHAPPCPGHKVQVRHTQDPHYANLRFCVSGEGGHAPPHTRRKTTVLHRQLRFWT